MVRMSVLLCPESGDTHTPLPLLLLRLLLLLLLVLLLLIIGLPEGQKRNFI